MFDFEDIDVPKALDAVEGEKNAGGGSSRSVPVIVGEREDLGEKLWRQTGEAILEKSNLSGKRVEEDETTHVGSDDSL